MRVIAGIMTLLFGLNLMAKRLQMIENTKLKRWMGNLAKHPILCVAFAALLSFLVQSSSTVVLMIIGLVAGNIVTMPTAFALLLGGNIGTAFYVPILQDIAYTIFVIAGIGAFFVWITTTRRDRQSYALVVLGTAFIFVGMDQLKSGLAILSNAVWFEESMRAIHGNWVAFMQGISFTTVVQSSRLSLSVISDYIAKGYIDVLPSIFFMLGANIATTSTAIFSTLTGSVDQRRTAILHFLINVFGVALAMPVLWVLPMTGLLNSIRFSGDNILWYSHIGFNLLTAIVFLPLQAKFLQLSELLIPEPMLVRKKTVPVKTDSVTGKTSLGFRTDMQALFRTTWAHAKTVFQIYLTRDVTLVERATQIAESIAKMQDKLKTDFFALMDRTPELESQKEILSLYTTLEDMIRIHEHCLGLFSLGSDRIVHGSNIDDLSLLTLRSGFRNALDLVYLCTQDHPSEEEELARALTFTDRLEESKEVFTRNVLMAYQEGTIDSRSAWELLETMRRLTQINEIALRRIGSDEPRILLGATNDIRRGNSPYLLDS